MNIITRLEKIIDGIYGDNFTESNIEQLIKDMKSEYAEHVEQLNKNVRYSNEYDADKSYISVAKLIEYLDIDSIEFNAGYERGVLNTLKENNK